MIQIKEKNYDLQKTACSTFCWQHSASLNNQSMIINFFFWGGVFLGCLMTENYASFTYNILSNI